MGDQRRVVMAIDGSEHSDRAFECKYLYTVSKDLYNFCRTKKFDSPDEYSRRIENTALAYTVFTVFSVAYFDRNSVLGFL